MVRGDELSQGMDVRQLQSIRFNALGTYVDLACAQEVDMNLVRYSLLEKVRHLDEVASCYRADSEIRRLYEATLAEDRETCFEVSESLWWLLSKAEEAKQITHGLLDVGKGGVLAKEYEIEDPGSVDVQGYVELTHTPMLVRLGRATLIDLHSLGKAYWAERCASELSVEFQRDVLVGLGGDISVSSTTGSTYFPIAIPKDGRSLYQSGDDIVCMSHGGVATSTKNSRRVYYSSGEVMHHIFDPRTLRPSSKGADVATVIGRSTGMCNVLSLMSLIDTEMAMSAIDSLGYSARLMVDDSPTFVGEFLEEVQES